MNDKIMLIDYVCGECKQTELLEVARVFDVESLKRSLMPCDWEMVESVLYCPECKGKHKARYQREWGKVQ